VCLGACAEVAAAALQQICVCEHTHKRYSSSIAVSICACVHAQEWWQQRSKISVIECMCVRSQSSATCYYPSRCLMRAGCEWQGGVGVERERGRKLEKDGCLVGKNPPPHHAVDILLNIILLTANKAWRILSFLPFSRSICLKYECLGLSVYL